MAEAKIYPEHAKLVAVRAESQACGEFIDWLNENGYTICRWADSIGEYYPAHVPPNTLLAERFGIDLGALEAEKRDMLEKIREENAK